MKKKYVLMIVLCLFMLPSLVMAANVSLSLNCPTMAVSGSEIECKVNITSDVLVNGVSANYTSVSGLTYVNFTPQSGFTAYTASASGFAIGNNSGKSGTYTAGTIKFKVNGAASFELSKIDISDTNFKSYSVGNKKASIRLASNDATLKALSLSNGSLSPSFKAGTTSYTASVDANSVTISATANSSGAKVSGTGNKSLSYGKNTFKVNVTSEAGSTKTYTIEINRPDNRSTNNNLASLSVSSGNISFNKNTTSYNLNVAADVTSVKISASVEDSKASFVSGFGARNVNLKYGKNTVLVKVKAENEKVKTYTININREDNRSTNNNLSSMSLSAGAISFDKNTLNYNVSVPYETTRVEINANVEDSKSTVVINNVDLVVGDNTATIVVTSESGATKTYTLNIKRLAEAEKMSDNNNVSSIDIFGHDFNLVEDVFEYDINVSSSEKDLLFNILMEDDRANYIIEGNDSIKDGSVVTVRAISESGIETEYKFNINKEKEIKQSKKSDFGIYVVACLFCLLIGYGMGYITPMVINKLKPVTVSGNSNKNLSNKRPIKKVVRKVKVVKKDEE